jgi:hypothetical protein
MTADKGVAADFGRNAVGPQSTPSHLDGTDSKAFIGLISSVKEE